MDDRRFDDLTRALVANLSRRTVIRILAGGLAGSALALRGGRRATAQDPTGCSLPCQTPDLTRCPTEPHGFCNCFFLDRDNDNCGACGARCPVGHSCSGGRCLCYRGGTIYEEPCHGSCFVNYDSDPAHCGGCDRACAADQFCFAGACYHDCATDGCPPCQVCDLTGGCVPDASRDGTFCGFDICTGDATCQAGTCQAGPPVDCGPCRTCEPLEGCVADTSLNGVAGSCSDGNACTAGDFCLDGACPGGQPVACGQCRTCDPALGCVADSTKNGVAGSCDDGDACTQDDVCLDGTCQAGTPVSCGACQACAGGACQADATKDNTSCGARQLCCDGSCVAGTTTKNCGACGNDCLVNQPANTVAACVNGQCAYACLAEFGNCDGNAANGCETDTTSNSAHCGGCNEPCGDGQVCQAGACCEPCGSLCCPAGTRGRKCNSRRPTCVPLR